MKKVVSLRLEQHIIEGLRVMARADKRSLSALMEIIIGAFMREYRSNAAIERMKSEAELD